jgi:aerobic-type carbon monoxide dehydrogenase small subunit (CoxS/CutS family)
MTTAIEKKCLITLTVNGGPQQAFVPPRRLLSDYLREDLGLTGTHVGCGTGECGSCTVIIDGETARSCLTLAVQTDGTAVETIEGVGKQGVMHPVQEAFHTCHALQCGFCTPGIVIAAVALLRNVATPQREDVANMLQGHLCRCTGYANIVEALHAVTNTGGH